MGISWDFKEISWNLCWLVSLWQFLTWQLSIYWGNHRSNGQCTPPCNLGSCTNDVYHSFMLVFGMV